MISTLLLKEKEKFGGHIKRLFCIQIFKDLWRDSESTEVRKLFPLIWACFRKVEKDVHIKLLKTFLSKSSAIKILFKKSLPAPAVTGFSLRETVCVLAHTRYDRGMRQNNEVWHAKISSIYTAIFHTYHWRRILYQIFCVSVLTTIWHTQEDLEQLEMKPIFVDQHLNAWWLIYTVSTCRAILAHILQMLYFYDVWSQYRIHAGPTGGVLPQQKC